MTIDVYPAVDVTTLKKFLTKVLYRAICDYVNYKRSRNIKGRHLHDEASTWLFGQDQTVTAHQTSPPQLGLCEHPCHYYPDGCRSCWTQKELIRADHYMSFESICGILGWDADWVRKRISKLTKADLQRIGKNGVL